jgi:hypothetical protein
VGFVSLVDDQLKRLRTTGHFLPPRFFGYYFESNVPIGVGGSWTVSLDATRPATLLPEAVEQVTHGQYSIVSPAAHKRPEFVLIHDRRDGACWLWSFQDGLRFIEAVEPTDGSDWSDTEERKLRGQ